MVMSKAVAVVTSLAKIFRPVESGQRDGAMHSSGEKENQMPPMLLARLISTASKSRKNKRSLADTGLEIEVISKCGSAALDDYIPSRTNTAKIKLERPLNLVEYSLMTVPESVHMVNPASVYVEMLKPRNSARGSVMEWHDKQAMHEYLKELMTGRNEKEKIITQ